MKEAFGIGVSSKELNGMGIPTLIDIVSKNGGDLTILSVDDFSCPENTQDTKEITGVSVDITLNLDEQDHFYNPIPQDKLLYNKKPSYFDREGTNEIFVKYANTDAPAYKLFNHIENIVQAGKNPIVNFSKLKTIIHTSFLDHFKVIQDEFSIEIRGPERICNILG